jgi:VanZ family protein
MKRILTIAVLVLTVAWIGFIFSNSMDSGNESGQKSSRVYVIVNEVAQSLGATEEIPESTIRTSAHFAEFAILGILIAADIALFPSLFPALSLSYNATHSLLAIPICTLLSVIDETIQRFSPGRAMQFIDVLIDASGAICGTLLLFAIHEGILRHRRQRKARAEHPSM